MAKFPPRDGDPIDVLPRPRRGRRLRLILVALIVLLFLGARGLISWYVEALWFGSLGYSDVFWRTLGIKAGIFAGFFVATYVLLHGSFWLLRPRRLTGDYLSRTILINGQPVTFSLGSVIKVVEVAVALLVAVVTGAGMMAEWTTLTLYWLAPQAGGAASDPIFGRTVGFYLFTLPAWDLLATWLTTLSVVALVASVIYFVLISGERAFNTFRGLTSGERAYGGISVALGLVLAVLAWRVYLSRFEELFHSGTIFSGVTYTADHILIPGLLVVCIALVVGAAIAIVNAIGPRRLLGIPAAIVPAVLVYVGLTVVAWYVNGFIVKPNELVREKPYITHNIDFTRAAFALTGVEQRAFPAKNGAEALNLGDNQQTLQNIRLWDWRALQDTLRQIQAIRTYYDFPDIDIDRYSVGGEKRQMMVAARELNVSHLPESSRNWINEKLIYTHGYGVTMNPVNGFTPEGLPQLVLSNMPVQSTTPDLQVLRPEIYFGQETTTDVYVRTRQKEFNYPQGESNNLNTYEGSGGIPIGSMLRRLVLALDRGDLAKLPFSDDVTPDSRLLMRREIRSRVNAITPFLTYDSDPYIVVGKDGRLYWLMDGFTSSNTYPYASPYRVGDDDVNYLRNSVKVQIDAYDGTVRFYVFDTTDPIIAAYQQVFPSLFRPAREMPDAVREHVRYPELLLEIQAAVYSLYHMTNEQAFYNREDLWSVANQVTLSETHEQVAQPLEPNFVLMRLPGETRSMEFVEILPFTPSKRNNLIGWIAGRSDGDAYGKVLVYDFPKSRLVDGPLQIEARIDQNPQLSSQLTLWNQQGSHVRRGSLLVIPIGEALLYAEPIYLQAERSPMPELRLVVLALQDRLGFGPTFDAAMQSLFGELAAGGTGAAQAPPAAPGAAGTQRAPGAAPVPSDVQALIDQAARDLADYQRLTADGKLGEAGQRLESLKKTLEKLRQGGK
jgi:uncharacterized membrane protein (UPF0182 family)